MSRVQSTAKYSIYVDGDGDGDGDGDDDDATCPRSRAQCQRKNKRRLSREIPEQPELKGLPCLNPSCDYESSSESASAQRPNIGHRMQRSNWPETPQARRAHWPGRVAANAHFEGGILWPSSIYNATNTM
ncbi:hypothetical protein H103_03929 [Trichophyton rubrum CBS 288.86]|uniref:Uncharacterized protein n=1 Tax=Trichophyton rubrum CBS 288.86 TaxID=1215330 RepID=A0A022W530_TRIRU|nr:hypothetical protein H103_03929 [Trichophyton rubrum CBS 288.86]EZF63635.1 hypothetical protein H104_03914 [Trichophyton rubrum CBS 289.86]EZF84988.1 hypothetical protein H110_03921 [Trichophyton rubrum MR1448]